MHLGSEYQVRVAAWLAVEMLAEEPGFFNQNDRVSILLGETQEPIDDILAGSSAGAYRFIQVKRKVSFSDRPDSEFISVIDQIVRQLVERNDAGRVRPWTRELDPSTDRLLLVTSSRSGNNINGLLRDVLNRASRLVSGQTLADAAVTQAEHGVLRKTERAVRSCWKAVTGDAPSDAEVLNVFRLFAVEVCDVETGEAGEREALRALAKVVVEDPAVASAAWSSVLKSARKMVADRSGLEIATLRRQMMADGIALRAATSFQSDIQRLQEETESTLEKLRDLSLIVLDGVTIHIDRDAVQELAAAAEEDSYLITGHPGAGKSGTLYDLAGVLRGRGDVVCLAADRHNIASLSALRSELGLQHNLVDVFENWLGSGPGYLLIDALDAARGTRAADALLELIQTVVKAESRWHVVACIRKFDLRYSRNLQEAFLSRGYGKDSRFTDPEFPFVRHINVPLLSDEELQQLETKAPSLYELYRGGSDDLRKLLHVSFNLRLAANLLGHGMRHEEFGPVQTQLDLLNRYWDRRVIDESGGDDREAVLLLALTEMVSKRRLQIDRQVCVVPSHGNALDQLLSRHVLTEWQPTAAAAADRRSIAFEHNFLFDFALSKLYLPADDSSLIRLLQDDPDAVIVLRPSLSIRAQQLWSTNPERFWKFTIAFSGADDLSFLAQMTPMGTVAENAADIRSVEPLLSALDSPSPAQAKAGRRAFRHLVGFINSGRTENKALGGNNAGPWCEMLERITRVPKPELLGLCFALIQEALREDYFLSPLQFSNVGLSARRVLDLAWQAERRNGIMIVHALRAVTSTFASDRTESALRVRRALTPERVRQFGYEEVHWLAHEVKTLMFLDPALTAEIYIAAFEWTETDESATPFSRSQIVPLISTKRQDAEQTRWLLGQQYPKFNQRAPIEAAKVMIALVEAYGVNRERESKRWAEEFWRLRSVDNPTEDLVEALLDGELAEPQETVESFMIEGHVASLKKDRFCLREDTVSSQDEAIQIFGSFFRYLEDLVCQSGQEVLALQIIFYLIDNNQQAIVWSKVLGLLSRHSYLTHRFKSFADATPLMLASETTEQFASFVHALHPLLSADERILLEERILAFGDGTDAHGDESAPHCGHQVLKALGDLELATNAARSRLAAIRVQENKRIERQMAEFGFRQTDFEEAHRMHRRGETAEEFEARQSLEPLTKPVEEFGNRHFNTVPSIEEVDELLPTMRDLLSAIERPEDALPESVLASAVAVLTGACRQITKIESLNCSTEIGTFVKRVLLSSSTSPFPPSDPEGSEEVASGSSAGWPVTRIVAAEGLLSFAANPACDDPEILSALENLKTDPAAKVRYPLARYALWLHKTKPVQMWTWLEEFSVDKSVSVRSGCAHALDYLGNIDAERALGMTGELLATAPANGEEARELSKYCVQALTAWHVSRNVSAARQAIYRVISSLPDSANQAISIPYMLREQLTVGAMNEEGDAAATRHRAVALYIELSHQSIAAVRAALDDSGQNANTDDERGATIRALIDLENAIGSELYFASGAHQPGRLGLPAEISRPEQSRLYWELTSVFDELATFGFPATAQHFIETLEMYIDTDPSPVFLRIASTVKAGKLWSYEYEDLAQTLVLRIVRRYLAEKRALLQEDQGCRRALRELVETFIEAGWPTAQQLAYRLDDIHR